MNATTAAVVSAAANENAAAGDTVVHRMPAMLLATRLPNAWAAARTPNVDPRTSVGAWTAIAVCSAVSTQPIATPAGRVVGLGEGAALSTDSHDGASS